MSRRYAFWSKKGGRPKEIWDFKDRSFVMTKKLKFIGKAVLFLLAGAAALVLLVIVGLNIAKYAIYSDYYSIKTNICKNPGLGDGFVCQGIAADEADGVILVSGYMKDGSASRIYVTNTDDESYYVQLEKGGQSYTGHAGGIAVTAGNAYVASANKVYTLPLADILSANEGEFIDMGEGTGVNNSASFIYTDDTHLYVGEFHDGGKYTIEGHENKTAEGTHYAICSKYDINDLTAPVAVYSIRNKVQGIAFSADGTVVMSTSYGLSDSYYYVYNVNDATDAEKTLDGAPVYYLDSLIRKVKAPAMAEGVDIYNGGYITLTESASDKYIFGKLFGATKIVSLDLSGAND